MCEKKLNKKLLWFYKISPFESTRGKFLREVESSRCSTSRYVDCVHRCFTFLTMMSSTKMLYWLWQEKMNNITNQKMCKTQSILKLLQPIILHMWICILREDVHKVCVNIDSMKEVGKKRMCWSSAIQWYGKSSQDMISITEGVEKTTQHWALLETSGESD